MKGAKRYLRLPLMLTLLMVVTLSGITHASLLCRSDPRVVLSNGLTLNVGANIGAQLTDVIEVHYEVHVPVGVTMTNVIHTPGWPWVEETFTLVADQRSRQYRVTTTVRTRLGNASVSAYTIVSTNSSRISMTVGGMEGRALTVSFSI